MTNRAETMTMYPLLLRPMLYPKVWGGDRLCRFGKAVKPGERVGESWELADLDATSSSGAGGGAARSIIANGALQGRTLRDACKVFGSGLLGLAMPSGGKAVAFPLLVKFLDARENLSVQVHPSIAYAKTHPGANIKTECWYILDAEPGSVIYKGVRAGVTRASFEQHLHEHAGAGVVDDLEAVQAIPGQMHNLPSGTVHALGAGVLIAEVQTPSDTTFRVYDWGRAGRELHIASSLECIQFGPARDATSLASGAAIGRLVSTGFYIVDELRLNAEVMGGDSGSSTMRLGASAGAGLAELGSDRAVVLMVLDGECGVRWSVNHADSLTLKRGDTAVVPAGIVGMCELTSSRPTKMLRVVTLGASSSRFGGGSAALVSDDAAERLA